MKKILFSMVLLFAANFNLYSMQQMIDQIDSLKKQLKQSKVDTNKVNLLIKLSYYSSRFNPNEGLEYGTNALELAKELDWEKGLSAAYSSVGTNYYALSDYNNSINYYKESLKLSRKNNSEEKIASALFNIGICYDNLGQFDKALDYFFQALEINEQLGNNISVCSNLTCIGNIFKKQGEITKSLKYYTKSYKIAKNLNDKNLIAKGLSSMALSHMSLKQNELALQYFNQSLEISKEIGNPHVQAANYSNIGLIKREEEKFDHAVANFFKGVEIYESVNNKPGAARNYGNIGEILFFLSQDSVKIPVEIQSNLISLSKQVNLNNSINYLEKAVKIFSEIGDIDAELVFRYNLSKAYKQATKVNEAYNQILKANKLKDSIYNIKKVEAIKNLENVRGNLIKEREIAVLKANQEKQNIKIIAFIGGLIALGIIIGIIYNQRKKSDALLNKILPKKIAKRLKANEREIADDIENATTVFIDLVGFTHFAKDKPASEVLRILNELFSRFDKLVIKHGLEKIKTIGDGYMAASGVPEPNLNHVKSALDFALDVREELSRFNLEFGMEMQARIGLDTGPVVAGVIGDNKFIYDLWGDTVNIASRMESTCLPSKIQVTENILSKLDTDYKKYQFDSREPFEVKGRGVMQTYFVERA